MIKDTVKFLESLITSKSANSSMRFIAVHSTLLITYVWAWVCIWRREFVDMPDGVIYFAAITIAGKVLQKFPEEISTKKTQVEEAKEDIIICDKCGAFLGSQEK